MAASPQDHKGWRSQPIVSTTSVDNDEFIENPSPLIYRSPAPPTHLPLVLRPKWPSPSTRPRLNIAISTLLQSMLPTCRLPSLPPSPSSRRRRRLTGTLFGPRRGRVTFAIQEDASAPPGLLLELAFPTCHLVQEMASGTVRILLECEKRHLSGAGGRKVGVSLWEEPVWTMYCNGRRSGYAVSRPWGEHDQHVFRTVGTVSAGAGVLPPLSPPAVGKGGLYGGDESAEMMFMRAKFERVVGSKDSEAFYMMSPDGGCGAGPELSIFLLRL